MLIWPNSLRSTTPSRVELGSTGGACLRGAARRMRIESSLQLTPREPYQQPWRYFSSQGHVIDSDEGWEDAAQRQLPIFLIEGGQFQWPPVEVGFRQRVEGLELDGTSIELETLSVRPPIFRVARLASGTECTELIAEAMPHFAKSKVIYMDKDRGKAVDEFRTSVDYRPAHNATPIISEMERRAAALTRMPHEHFEAPQILKYGLGGYYHAHDDAARLQFYAANEELIARHHYGHYDRMLTLFWYMNTVPEGGETNFPRAGGLPAPSTMTSCVQGLRVQPEEGVAVLWYNMDPAGSVDECALHAACAVEAGEKYAINIWVYNKPLATRPAEWDPDHPRLPSIRGVSGPAAGGDLATEASWSPKRSLELVNAAAQGSSSVEVYWLGPQEPSLIAQVKPGERRHIDTFVGHHFEARLAQGVVARYEVALTPARQQFRFEPHLEL